MEQIYYIICMIAIGIICLGYPIIMLLYIWYLPFYVIASFGIWLIASIVCIALPAQIKKKWYESLLLPIVFTLIFTFIFVSSIDRNHYLFDDNYAMWFFAPSLCLPAIFFIGNKVRAYLEDWKNAQLQEKKRRINKDIQAKQKELHLIEGKLCQRNNVESIINLLSCCGGKTEGLKNHPTIVTISKINQERNRVLDQIKTLEEELKRIDDC